MTLLIGNEKLIVLFRNLKSYRKQLKTSLLLNYYGFRTENKLSRGNIR